MLHKSCTVFALATLLPFTAIVGQLPSSARAPQRDTLPVLRDSTARVLDSARVTGTMPALVARGVSAQASVAGSVFDSLSHHAPIANAIVVLVERSRYATTDTRGRFRFDSVPAGRYSLGILHPVLDSFDLVLPTTASVDVVSGSHVEVELAIPSAATAYSNGCRQRPITVANKADLTAYLRVARECAELSRRAIAQLAAANHSASPDTNNARKPQFLAPVTVRDTARSMSLMALDGFYERRTHGLGRFMTEADIKKQPVQRLAELFGSIPGIHVEYGTNGQPMIYMIGIGKSLSPYCVPTLYIDGTPYSIVLDEGDGGVNGGSGRFGGGKNGGGGSSGGASLTTPFNDISLMIHPEMITGLEVYETSGVIPAQYDRTSSTGCGSIVIWTR